MTVQDLAEYGKDCGLSSEHNEKLMENSEQELHDLTYLQGSFWLLYGEQKEARKPVGGQPSER